MSAAGRVLLLGLDAADAALVAQLCARGAMPNLQRLRATGLTGALESPADLFAGGVWPTFYTARPVAAHGIFHNKLWRPSAMRVDIASDDWIDARPFWELLPDPGRSVCIIDVPMVLGAPRAVNGVYLGGWGTHDLISRGSWPPELWADCVRRYGAPAMPVEHFGRQSARSLRDLPQQLIAATQQLTAVALDLMQRDAWDVTCIVLSAPHRAGHYLWDRSQVEAGSAGDGPHPDLIGIYREVDAAVGRILDHVAADTLVIAFAVHGMAANPGWSDLLPDLLARLQAHASGTRARRGVLYRARRAIPFHWARPVLNRLPLAANQRLVSLWSSRMFDWSTTRWFPVPMDEAGYVRISVRGRERDGIVEPGAEYDALCTELTGLLLALRDSDTGRPLADTVVRAFADAPPDAPGRELLPDLVVPWSGPRARDTARVVSAALPRFRYDVPATLPSGRAGNHTSNAWFTARGPGVATGEATRAHSVLDLVPTALHHLGVTAAGPIAGSPIDLTDAR